MNKFLLSRSAEKDLEEIWLYVGRESVGLANRFLKSLTGRFPVLADFPDMGVVREDLFPEDKDSGRRPGASVRCLPFKSYLIFYRKRSPHRIEILRVVHAARDLSALFDQP